MIWWEGGFRKLRFAVGPDPPVTDQAKAIPTGTLHHMEDLFPSVYKDLAEVCSEDKCEELPPYRLTNCAIELIPGAILP